MGFVRIPQVEGLVFVPEPDGQPRKHRCADCFSCQMCDDKRCSACLKLKSEARREGGCGSRVRCVGTRCRRNASDAGTRSHRRSP